MQTGRELTLDRVSFAHIKRRYSAKMPLQELALVRNNFSASGSPSVIHSSSVSRFLPNSGFPREKRDAGALSPEWDLEFKQA
jgi:hypothetical protein